MMKKIVLTCKVVIRYVILNEVKNQRQMLHFIQNDSVDQILSIIIIIPILYFISNQHFRDHQEEGISYHHQSGAGNQSTRQ